MTSDKLREADSFNAFAKDMWKNDEPEKIEYRLAVSAHAHGFRAGVTHATRTADESATIKTDNTQALYNALAEIERLKAADEKVKALVEAAEAVLYHDERGQGQNYWNAMKAMKAMVKAVALLKEGECD